MRIDFTEYRTRTSVVGDDDEEHRKRESDTGHADRFLTEPVSSDR